MRIKLGSIDITIALKRWGVRINFNTDVDPPTSNTFSFNPSEYGIIQGVVSDAVALNNTIYINTALQDAVASGADTFEVPAMDVYFETGGEGKTRNATVDAAIVVPDNMHFKMHANTVLRRQPNNKYASTLLGAIYTHGNENRKGENIKISGGTLVGDINQHIYTQYQTITSPATTTLAAIRIKREYVNTVYEIPVTISDVVTNASEIATWLDTNVPDLNATANGAIITIDAGMGVYVLMDDDSTDTSNIEISYGSRYTHEYGFGISLYGCHNAIIQDVYIKDFHGDAIFIDKTGLRNTNGTIPSNIRSCENVLIQRVTTENCRRQGISVVDCNGYEEGVALPTPGGSGSRVGVIIDDCDITDTGRDIYALPGYGIDLECYRQTGAEYARVENVIIKNTRFSGNRKGDVNLYNSQYVELFNNSFSYKIGHVASNNISIHDNTFDYVNTFPQNYASSYAIALDRYLTTNYVHDIDIYNNIISGYTFGIRVSGEDFNIYGNTITNLNPLGGVAFGLGSLKNFTYHDNTVNIGGSDVLAYESATTGTTTENLRIYNETITATLIPDGNALQNATAIRLRNITVTGTLAEGTGILIENSSFSGTTRDVEVINCNDVEFVNCTYNVVNQSGNTNVIIP